MKRRLARECKRAVVAAVAVPFRFKAAVAEEFYASSNADAGGAPGRTGVGLQVGPSYWVGDIIVYRDPAAGTGRIVVARSGEADVPAPVTRVVGRIVLGTR